MFVQYDLRDLNRNFINYDLTNSTSLCMFIIHICSSIDSLITVVKTKAEVKLRTAAMAIFTYISLSQK
jgi:hypothetical protein